MEYSSCAEDTYGYRGIALHSEIPCSVAKADHVYPLQGAAYVGGQVQVALYSSPQREWIYTCSELDEDGLFDTDLSFDTEVFGSSAYMMISPAGETRCSSYQSWDRSILVSIR